MLAADEQRSGGHLPASFRQLAREWGQCAPGGWFGKVLFQHAEWPRVHGAGGDRGRRVGAGELRGQGSGVRRQGTVMTRRVVAVLLVVVLGGCGESSKAYRTAAVSGVVTLDGQ